jgi:hypothetical protein
MWHIDIKVAQGRYIPAFGSLGVEGIIYIQTGVTGRVSENSSTLPVLLYAASEKVLGEYERDWAKADLWPDQSNGVFLLYI